MSQNNLNILFIGDIIGKLGRQLTADVLPGLKKQYSPDLIIANGENSAGGFGINQKIYNELKDLGIHVFTSGNHIWDKKEFVKNVDSFDRVIRPANYPAKVPGKTHIIVKVNNYKIGIVNLLGNVFVHPCVDCPFKSAEELIAKLKQETNIIIVDMHAEATSEKQAIGFFLDGKVSAVLGTHTHVQTADNRILPNQTAYISDVGMVGGLNSIIGMDKENVINRFLTHMPAHFEPVKTGPGIFNAVLITINPENGKAVEIKRIFETLE